MYEIIPVVSPYEGFYYDWRYHWRLRRFVRMTRRVHPTIKWVRTHSRENQGLDSSIGRHDYWNSCRYTRRLMGNKNGYEYPDGFLIPYIPELPFFMAHIETEQIIYDEDGEYSLCVGVDVSTWQEIHAFRRCGPGISGGYSFPDGYRLAVDQIRHYALTGSY